jgi:hypothetical protein
MRWQIFVIAACLALIYAGYADDPEIKGPTVSCNGGIVHFQQFSMTHKPAQKASTYG